MKANHTTLQRRMALLRALCRQPGSRDELCHVVNGDLETRAYDFDDAEKAQTDFKNDLRELRALGVEIEYHKSDQEYSLISYGDFSPVDLNPVDLHTLAFLIETFEPGTPNHIAVHQLLERISSWLPPEPRASLASRRQHVRIDLQRRDSDRIDPNVRRQLEEAIGKRVVRFQYMAPSQEDGIPRTQTVQPWRLYFDTWRGHYYLDGYWLEVSGPYGRFKQEKWQQYRLGRILSDGFEVLPTRLPPEEPRRKRWPLAYKLAPYIARDGRVTAHFENTQIHEPDEDGWVPVTAITTNLFQARQILLSYGAGCVVTGGTEIRDEVTNAVKKMQEMYAEIDEGK